MWCCASCNHLCLVQLRLWQSRFISESDCSLFIVIPPKAYFCTPWRFFAPWVLTKVQADSLFYSLQLAAKYVGGADGSAKLLCNCIKHAKSCSTLQLAAHRLLPTA